MTSFPRLALVACFPALGIGCMISRAWHQLHVSGNWHRLYVFPRWLQFSRAWHWLHVFPRLGPAVCFPALVTIFPRLAPVACFPALRTSYVTFFSSSSHTHFQLFSFVARSDYRQIVSIFYPTLELQLSR